VTAARRSNRFNGSDGSADSPSNGSDRFAGQEAEAFVSGVPMCSVSQWSLGPPPRKKMQMTC